MKPTPGPWKVYASHEELGLCYGLRADTDTGVLLIARTSGSTLRSRSDAYLMAAAPELLALVRDFVGRYGLPGDQLSERALALIELAEGRVK